ncbi:MAG TPA: lipoprotein [Woeseiaceae bacterium]|nr:lipoprotein [Woeseiaceae bacterium]
MRSRIPHLTALFGLLLLAAGCGQKGPLFLPGDPDEGRTVIPGTEQEVEPELDPNEDADVDAQEEPPRR